ncbi:relaxase/mobilization nuclease domain-containing protein [Massilia timonae]|uniref:relaxase/mobilization nuclease domain-containing protein n=1 Tax=Massilia timonae TaxID=47229 RepID=UPI0028D58B76|nr:relaxase/mobilization nuclease domain-containing protein [Massilia timonae]
MDILPWRKSRFTIHEPFHAYRTLARVCDTVEDDFEVRKDNHVPPKVERENRAADGEHQAGIESLLGWIRRGCKEQMQQEQLWEQLHAVPATNGLHLHPRANGLAITAQNGSTVEAARWDATFQAEAGTALRSHPAHTGREGRAEASSSV